MIVLDHFSFRYDGCEQYALRDINLTIEDSSLFIVTGLSSSGKSTFLEAIAGIVPFCTAGTQSGRILLEHEDISLMEPVQRAKRIGFIGEDIMAQMVCVKVEDEIRFGLENLGISADAVEKRAGEAMETLGITSLANRSISSLSGGQRQRTAIAAMTALMPPVLLLDNPAGALDPSGAEELYKIMKRLAGNGMTVIAAEERSELYAPYADKILLLEKGRAKCVGSTEAVYKELLTEGGTNTELVPKTARFTAELSRMSHRECVIAATAEKAASFAMELSLC